MERRREGRLDGGSDELMRLWRIAGIWGDERSMVRGLGGGSRWMK